jgi:hypothetical protein
MCLMATIKYNLRILISENRHREIGNRFERKILRMDYRIFVRRGLHQLPRELDMP